MPDPLCPFCGTRSRAKRKDGLWASACGEVDCTRKARELIAGAYAKRRARAIERQQAQAREPDRAEWSRMGKVPGAGWPKEQPNSIRVRPTHCYRLLPDVVARLAAYATSIGETKSAILERLILSLPDVRVPAVHSPLAESTPDTPHDPPKDTEQK